MSIELLIPRSRRYVPGCLHYVHSEANDDYDLVDGSVLIDESKNVAPNARELQKEVFSSAMKDCGFNTSLDGKKLFTDFEIELAIDTGILDLNYELDTNWKAHMCVGWTRAFRETSWVVDNYIKLKEEYPDHKPVSYYITSYLSAIDGGKVVLPPNLRSRVSDESLFNNANILSIFNFISLNFNGIDYSDLLVPFNEDYVIVYNVHKKGGVLNDHNQAVADRESELINKYADDIQLLLTDFDNILEFNNEKSPT